MMSARLAVDIGGTFTDVVLETADGAHALKVLTTTDAPERGVQVTTPLIAKLLYAFGPVGFLLLLRRRGGAASMAAAPVEGER